jgi:predicted permease
MLNRLLMRLRLYFASNSHTEVDEEIQFHVDREMESNLAKGLDPGEARRLAIVAFGGVEKSREQCREQRPGYWIETLLQDVRYAVRGLKRDSVWTAAVILTLMLGVGATTAVFSVVDRILFRSLPYSQGDRLVSVGLVAPIEPQEFMLGGSYYEWRDNQKPFVALTSETGVTPCDLTEEKPVRLSCASVEESFLPTLGVVPIIGRNFTPEEDTPHGPKVALLSYALWKSRFHLDRNVAGKSISLDGHSVEIVGVLPQDFEMPRLQAANILLPQALDVAGQRRADPGRPMWAFARLKPGVTLEQAKAQLQPLFEYSLRLAPAAFRKEVHLQVRSLRDRQIHDVRLLSWILFGLAMSVLLIACANVAGLLMARSASRERELAVRAALGASRLRLARQSMTESLVLGVAGAVAGCVFAEMLLHLFLMIAPQGMPFLSKARIDLRILFFALLSSILCAVAYGLVPALRRPRAEALGYRTGVTRPQSSFRRCLVVVQIAASLVLLVSSALLVRSFRNLQNQALGFQGNHVISASISLGRNSYPTPESQIAFFQQLIRNLRYGPAIRTLAVSDSLPPGGQHHDQIYASIAAEGRPKFASGTGGNVAWRWVTPEYFRTLGIPIVRGRAFSEEELSSKDHFVILSRLLAARLFPGIDPIGQRLHLAVGAPDSQNPWYTVVGIAADVKNGGLTGTDEPEYYRLRRNRPEDWDRNAIILLETSLTEDNIASWLRSQISALDPTVPMKLQTLSERVSEMAAQPRFEAVLVSFFGLTGLALAMIGLYGVVSFAVVQRTQEFGVRMALGATRGDILALVLKSGLRLILWGTTAGLLLALAASRMLASLLYKISAHDLLAFSVGTLFMAAIAIVATLVPARSATAVNPAVALRRD